MEIAHWMTRRVHTLKPGDSVAHAREMMEKRRLNQLPVVIDGRLVGIVTDRDVRDACPSLFESGTTRRKHGLPPAADPTRIEINTVMTSHVLTLAPADSVVAAAQLMRWERLGSVPILEGARLVGIITRSDILDAFLALSDATQDVIPDDLRRPTRVAVSACAEGEPRRERP